MSGTTGTPTDVNTLMSTQFQDGQPAKSISPQRMRNLIASLAAISGVTSVASKTGPVVLTHNDISDWASAIGGAGGGSGNSAILLASSFGVQADGSHDDTTAWNNALTAATAGQIVFAPPGISLVSTITVPGGVTLVGCHTPVYSTNPGGTLSITSGSVLQKVSGGGPAVILSGKHVNNTAGTDQLIGGSIRNVAIVGTAATSCVQACNNTTQGPCYIDNCTIINGAIGVDGDTVSGLGQGYGWAIVTNCSIGSCGVGLKNFTDSRIINCFINGNSGNGIEFGNGSSDVIVANNKIEFNAGYGLYTTQTDGVVVVGNNFDASGLAHVHCESLLNLVLTGNVFRRGGNTQANNHSIDDCHIYVIGCDKVVITGNTTRAMSASDGSGPVVPSYTMAGGVNTSVILSGNALTGRATAFLNPSFTPTGLVNTGNST